MEENKRLKEARRWIAQGEHDLKTAKLLEKNKVNTSCFPCQQAAEKALKEALTLTRYSGVVTHSAAEPYSLLQKAQKPVRNLSESPSLGQTPYSNTQTLYPNALSRRAFRRRAIPTLHEGGCRRMHKFRRLDIKRSKETLAKVKHFVQNLGRRTKLQRVYLFNSFTRGDNEGSDVGLLIVGGLKERLLDRHVAVRSITLLPIEHFYYTPEEMKKMKAAENPLIKKAVRGKLLFAS